MGITPTFDPDYSPVRHDCGEIVLYARRRPVAGELLKASDYQLADGRWPCAGEPFPSCPMCGPGGSLRWGDLKVTRD